MLSSYDYFLIALYLAFTLWLGLKLSSEIKTLNDFSLGGRRFSNITMAMTISATWLSGAGVLIWTKEGYEQGLMFFIANSAILIAILLMIFFVAPRIGEFFNSVSVGDMMFKIYGPKAKIISSVTAFALSFGYIASQIKALGMFFTYFFETDIMLTTVVTSLIIVIYSASGGIRAVTFTDVVQFVTVAVTIPLMALLLLKSAGGYQGLVSKLPDKFFAIDYTSPDLPKYTSILLLMLIPRLNPAITQRLLMAKNVQQIRYSFQLTFLIWVGFLAITTILIMSSHAIDSSLEGRKVFMNMLDIHIPDGVKALIIIGILAIAMSTADSHLNCAAVALVHDFFGSFQNTRSSDEKIVTRLRIATVVTGLSAIYLALQFQSLLDLILFVQSLYTPIVSVPLLLGILGFRTSDRNFIIAAICSSAVLITWAILDLDSVIGIKSVIFAMLVNGVALTSSHYFSKSSNLSSAT